MILHRHRLWQAVKDLHDATTTWSLDSPDTWPRGLRYLPDEYRFWTDMDELERQHYISALVSKSSEVALDLSLSNNKRANDNAATISKAIQNLNNKQAIINSLKES